MWFLLPVCRAFLCFTTAHVFLPSSKKYMQRLVRLIMTNHSLLLWLTGFVLIDCQHKFESKHRDFSWKRDCLSSPEQRKKHINTRVLGWHLSKNTFIANLWFVATYNTCYIRNTEASHWQKTEEYVLVCLAPSGFFIYTSNLEVNVWKVGGFSQI